MGMSFLCFYFLPDADRIISRFAGTQFFFEGLSTASLLVADRRSRDVALSGAGANTSAAVEEASTAGGGGADVGATSLILQMQLAGFVLSLFAMSTPVIQVSVQAARPSNHLCPQLSPWIC